MELLFKLFVVLGAVLLPILGGNSAALRCGVLGMSQLMENDFISKSVTSKPPFRTHPLAKIGVSGKLQEVCSLRSSLGLGIDFFGNAPDTNRRLELMPGNSGGSVPGWWPPEPTTIPPVELNEGLR